MGTCVALMRLQQITKQKSELEYQILLAGRAKQSIVTQSTELVNSMPADSDEESPQTKALNERLRRLKVAEQQIDQKLQQYNAQLQMLEAEEGTVKNMMQKGMQSSFG